MRTIKTHSKAPLLLGFKVWISDVAEISRKRVRKQKTGREDVRT